MTGSEFRAACATANLTIREAAERLDVAKSTIQRWREDDAEIPEDKAQLVSDLATGEPRDHVAARGLGRLFAILERASREDVPRSVMSMVQGNPAAAMGQYLTTVRVKHPQAFARIDREIEEVMEPMPAQLPRLFDSELLGIFQIGYYHQRRELRVGEDGSDQPGVRGAVLGQADDEARSVAHHVYDIGPETAADRDPWTCACGCRVWKHSHSNGAPDEPLCCDKCGAVFRR